MSRMTCKLGILGLVSLFSVSAFASAQSGGFRADVVYGDDDRLDMYQVTDPTWRAIADSTVALFESRTVIPQGGQSTLLTTPFGERMNLCTSEPFYDQGSGAFCSGSLVAPDLIMTAGHCINTTSCSTTKIVFGFAANQPGATVDSAPTSEVYNCRNVVQHSLNARTGLDYALIRLDRAVTNHRPLAINRDPSTVTQGTQLVIIGHPSGLPTKVAGGAYVRDASHPIFLVANTDSYGGNSGSAVFNAETGLIEGILVQGEEDFVPNFEQSCNESKKCDNEGCSGELITKISHLSRFIPN